MTHDQFFEQIRAIRQANPGNLMARHFDEKYLSGLDGAARRRLEKVIKTGIENPDNQMGAYAMNSDDYDRFSPMLDPMIRNFHGLATGAQIAQKHDSGTPAPRLTTWAPSTRASKTFPCGCGWRAM